MMDEKWFAEYARQEETRRQKDFNADTNRLARLRHNECRACYYLLGGMAGQAFTEFTCATCGGKDMHENTAVPLHCKTCATEKNICRCCGQKMD